MTDLKNSILERYLEKPQTLETWSGFPVKEIYGPEDLQGKDFSRDIGKAGEFPFTRGIYPNMYRGKYWTRREVTGFGTGKDTNERLKFQIREGASGLSVILDVLGSLGLDADHPRSRNEIGVQGVNYTSLKDMLDITEGLPLDRITMSFNISQSPTVSVVLAAYILAAEKQGIAMNSLRGTTQNDFLHRRYYAFRPSVPIDLGLKMAIDNIEFCTRHMPQWNTININLYDMREMGINAAQEIAFGFSHAKVYVRESIRRGLKVDDFAPRVGFYCSSHMDFFEEIAKLRACRRLWAKMMRDEFGASDPKSMKFRFGIHTAGCSLVPQQPLNNIIRVAYEALAAVLAGGQSIHCCSYDEPIALPTEESQQIALRTQQILAYETGVARVADPLGGSYYVESLTDQIEAEAVTIMKEIEDMGGMIAAMKREWVDREIEKAALKQQRDIDVKKKIVVGVNDFTSPPADKTPGGVHRSSKEAMRKQEQAVIQLKRDRNKDQLIKAIENLRRHADMGEKENLVPPIMEAVKSYATLEEIIGTIRQSYGLSYDPVEIRKSPFFPSIS